VKVLRESTELMLFRQWHVSCWSLDVVGCFHFQAAGRHVSSSFVSQASSKWNRYAQEYSPLRGISPSRWLVGRLGC